LGPKIGIIAIFADTVHANADAVQTGIKKLSQFERQTAIGIHIDSAAAGLLTNLSDGRFDDMGRQQGITFTALTETDNAFFNTFDMSQRHFGNFLRGGGEGDAVLAVVDAGILLQGETTQAAGIALF